MEVLGDMRRIVLSREKIFRLKMLNRWAFKKIRRSENHAPPIYRRLNQFQIKHFGFI
jgi:hypothetical protein